MRIIHNRIWLNVFDDAADAAAAKAAADAKAAEEAAKNKSFTQDQVNKMLAEDRRKHQEATQRALDELEALKTKSKLTAEERTDLENRLEEMRNQLLTKEELTKKEQDKLAKKYKEDTEKLANETKTWRTRYESSTIQRAITEAAVANNAFVPEQIIAILQSSTRLVEDLDDDGKPKGTFSPKVQFPDINKEGKPVVLDLPIEDAVKRMTEIEKYGNLFKASGGGGTNSFSRASGKKLDAATLAKDPVAYRKARADGTIK